MTSVELTHQQITALDILHSGENVFLTGGAGSGKSFLIRHFMRELDPQTMPILASTGAAAVLIGGRTFHSFFGLGIMEGGPDATFARASNDKRLAKRLREVEGIILDEISMISGESLMIAEALAHGVPVLTTVGAPWPVLTERAMGWRTAISVEGLAAGLVESTALDVSALRAMGERGRAYVGAEFGWDHVARQFLATYSAIVAKSTAPGGKTGKFH